MKYYFHDHFEGKSYLLSDKLIIGRSSNAEISIPDDSKLSSRHLEITIQTYAIHIMDCNTSNGTLLNGVTIEKNVSTPINIGDIINIGKKEFILSDVKAIPGNLQISINKETSLVYDSPKEKIDNLREIVFDTNKESDKVKVTTQPAESRETTGPNHEIDERESKYKQEIRNHNIKIRNLKRSLEKLEGKKTKRLDLLEQIEKIDNKYLNKKDSIVEAESCYKEHKREWESWSLKIKKLKRELSILQDKRENIAPKMEFFETYLDDTEVKNTMLVDIKKLNREDLNERVIAIKRKIIEEEEGIKRQDQFLKDLEIEKVELKKLKQERIKEEIKRLQAELDKAS